MYDNNGIDGLHDLSRVPRTIKYKVDTATEETILDLRLKRFGCNRIRFWLQRLGVYLSSRTMYKILKRHSLNILKCKIKNRKYSRFAMKNANDINNNNRYFPTPLGKDDFMSEYVLLGKVLFAICFVHDK